MAKRGETRNVEAIAPMLTGVSGSVSIRSTRKRSLDSSEEAPSDDYLDQDDSASDIDVSGALNGLGYMSHHHHLVLSQGSGPKVE